MNEVKLKPCPFCGGEAYTFYDSRLYCEMLCGVACSACGALVYIYPSKSQKNAIKLWNTRYEPPTPGGAIVPAGNERLRG